MRASALPFFLLLFAALAQPGAALAGESTARPRPLERKVLLVSQRGPFTTKPVVRGNKTVNAGVKSPAGGLANSVNLLLEKLEKDDRDKVTWLSNGPASVPKKLNPMCKLASVKLGKKVNQTDHAAFANQALWPSMHGSLVIEIARGLGANFDAVMPSLPRLFGAYEQTNRAFARATVRQARKDGSGVVVAVQDYQLMLVPGEVRKKLPGQKISWFCHIPFPDPKALSKESWWSGFSPYWKRLVTGVLGADLAQFHTPQFSENFLATCELFGFRVERKGQGRGLVTLPDGRAVRVSANPIGLGREPLMALSREPAFREEVKQLRGQFGNRKLILAMERGDFTKGVVPHLEAYEKLLEKKPQLAKQYTFVQFAASTRQELPAYAAYQQQIEAVAQRIVKRFGPECLKLFTTSAPPRTVLTYASIADVFMATPSADGYNITPLEFATVNRTRKAAPAVVLSEGAGSSWDLRGTARRPGAILTPPPTHSAASVSAVATALERAVSMPTSERRARLQVINEGVRNHPVDKWFRNMIEVGN